MNIKFTFTDKHEAVAVLGRNDEHIRIMRAAFTSVISTRGDSITIDGADDEVKTIRSLLGQLQNIHRSGNAIHTRDVEYRLHMIGEQKSEQLSNLCEDCIVMNARGRQVKPRTIGQKQYIDAVRNNSITIGIGPAGTGKTYLAVALAAQALKNRDIERLILSRPAVEAGEKLGFLPGDLQE